MKLPFDFGIKLLFRLLLPGFMLTAGLSPLSFFIFDWINWPASHVYFLIFAIIVSGWFILVLDMPIYMAFEGRRYWPRRLRSWLIDREHKRLAKLRERTAMSVLNEIEKGEKQIETEQDVDKRKKLQQALDAADNDLIEAYFDIRNFRIDDKGNHSAKFPTRLGNLIDAYEHYPERVYGMESVFYWPRLWLKLDSDVKEDIDGRQAIADSTVYVSSACFFNGAVWLVFTLLYGLNALVLRLNGAPLLTPRHTLFEHLPRWWASLLIMSGFVLAGFLLYRTSLRLHAQFGEIFKSVFDVFHGQITVSRVVGNVADYANDYSFVALPEKQRLEVAWRYLQFGLILCPRTGCRERIALAQMREHLKSHTIPTEMIKNDGNQDSN